MSAETHRFEAEATQVLDLMIHSLYSHKEIFLRELISNASDALDKLRFEALQDAALKSDALDYEIRIEADPEARTLTMHDNGIGMSHDELVTNIGTIAKSGTREMLKLLKEKQQEGVPDALIGQFGVGFYSSFMVADKVTLETRRAGEDSARRWTSEGKDSYVIEDAVRPSQGTSITLHLKEVDEEHGIEDFTQEWVLRRLIKKYSDFIAHPVKLKVTRTEAPKDDEGNEVEGAEAVTTTDWELMNTQKPIWLRPTGEVEEHEYNEFYKNIASDWTDPMRRIQFKAEGTFDYSALLYIPSQPPFDIFHTDYKHGLRLYVKRVLIQEQCDELLPRFLRMVKGVVDSPDLPLNVSREILQHNRYVAQIKKRVTKKVLDELEDMQQNHPDEYKKFWESFGLLLKEGIAARDETRDRIFDLLMLQSTNDPEKLTTLKEYVSRMKDGQENIYYLSGESRALLEASPHLEAVQDKGFEVLLLTDPIDEFMMRVMTDYEDKKFQALGKGEVDLGGSDEDKEKEEEARKEQEKNLGGLIEAFSKHLDSHVKEVRLSNRLKTSAACLVDDDNAMSPHLERLLNPNQPLQARRRILELNAEHPVVAGLKRRLESDADDAKLNDYIDLLYGQAVLAEGEELPNPTRFNKVLSELMGQAL